MSGNEKDQSDQSEAPCPTLIFDALDKEYRTRTGIFTPEDPLDTTVPLPGSANEDPVIGNTESV